jgi:hypothetical protein
MVLSQNPSRRVQEVFRANSEPNRGPSQSGDRARTRKKMKNLGKHL